MNRVDVLLWVVLPYAAITVFVVGHIWRYRTDQVGWTTRSTQLLENRRLRAAVLLFHLGFFAVLGGHVLGILVPASWTAKVGVSEDLYHVVSLVGGISAGVAMTVGFVLLMLRRDSDPRLRSTTRRADRLVYLLLAVMIITGMWGTVIENLILHGASYRNTVSPYFRGLFLLDPQTSLITSAALVYKIHVVAAWFLYMLWPFSRLVHAWSIPFSYLSRSNILYRGERLPQAAAGAREGANR